MHHQKYVTVYTLTSPFT